MDETARGEAKEGEAVKTGRQVCDEDGKTYLDLVKRISWLVAVGVAICILSPVCMFILIGKATAGAAGLTEDLAGGIGVAVLLCICAVGVAFFIVTGIKLAPFAYLEKEELALSEELKTYVRERKQANTKAFTIAVTVGVVLCIISVLPVMLAGALGKSDHILMYALAGLFPIAACGVFLFVRFGMVHGSFDRLLQEGDYSVERKRATATTETFAGAYWCFITAVYLAVSFITMKWQWTWTIWPVAGVTFVALQQILVAIRKKKK